MTDCGLECDSNQCILDCWAKFLDAHRDCPCEVNQVDLKWTLLTSIDLFCVTQLYFQANCPNGCPCDSYECDGISPGFEIEGPITIGESQKVESISGTGFKVNKSLSDPSDDSCTYDSGRLWSLYEDYEMNFDFSFDFKPNSIPDGYGHVLQVGQTEVSSYEDSMAFLFYNKNDYFQGGISKQ